MNKQDIQLVAFQDEDVAVFTQWLDKAHFYKWFCCDGKEGESAHMDGLEERQAWLEEVTSREENPHRHPFIVNCQGEKIGFGVCIDLMGEPEYVAEQYPDLKGKIKVGEAFELGYGIGEGVYLNKGIGKIIIEKLEEKCYNLGALLLLADPNEENIPSVKVLLANGFVRHKDGDYRKHLR